MAKHRYEYHHCDKCSLGFMRCDACGKSIVEGEFRARENSERYVLHHRACSADDPNWARRDQNNAERIAFNKARSDACRDFMAKWDVVGLEDYVIDEPEADAMAFSLVAPSARAA